MATRRKKDAEVTSDVARGFAVVVEEMRGHFQVFGEKLGVLGEQVTKLGEQVTKLDEQVTKLGEQVTKLDERVTKLDERVTRLDERVTRLEDRVTRIEDRVTRIEDRVTRLDERVTRLDERVTTGFAAMELRFDRVDHQIGLLQVAVLETRQELKKKVDRDEVEPIAERVFTRMTGR